MTNTDIADGNDSLPTRRITFQLVGPEIEQFMTKVALSGLTQSKLIRQCILSKAEAPNNQHRSLYLLNLVMLALHQIARQAAADHAAGSLPDSTFEAVLHELRTIKTLTDSIA